LKRGKKGIRPLTFTCARSIKEEGRLILLELSYYRLGPRLERCYLRRTRRDENLSAEGRKGVSVGEAFFA